MTVICTTRTGLASLLIKLWNDSKNLSNAIVSDFFTHAAVDLSEIYNLPIITVCSSLMTFDRFEGVDLAFEYLSYASVSWNIEVSDSSFIRAFRYFYRKIDYFFTNHFLSIERNQVREKFNLAPVSRYCSSNSKLLFL